VKAVATDGRGGLRLVDVPVPAVPQDGAHVAVTLCGLCGSDVEKLALPGLAAGRVLGHEVAGWLESSDGEPVRVALAHHVPCGRCGRCRSGHSSLCVQFTTTGLDPGGFAERLAVGPLHLADAVFPLPDAVDDLTGTLLEPLSCVLRALDAAAGARAGFPLPAVGGGLPERRDEGPLRVLVAGCGSMGLLFLAVLAAERGGLAADTAAPPAPGTARPAHSPLVAGDPFCLDRDPARASFAVALGAQAWVPGDVDPPQVAVVTAPGALAGVVASMAPGGVVVVFAGPRVPVALDLDVVYRRELTLLGVRSGSPAHLRRAIDLLAGGNLPLSWFRPEIVSLEGLPDAARRYVSGEVLKVVVRCA
jgi:L-iditol 2-dehydrogenase